MIKSLSLIDRGSIRTLVPSLASRGMAMPPLVMTGIEWMALLRSVRLILLTALGVRVGKQWSKIGDEMGVLLSAILVNKAKLR